MVQSLAVRLSICAPASAPLTDSDAVARSALRPTSTAESVTGWPAGAWPLLVGAIVRTMGGAVTADGDAAGLAAAAGFGCGAAGDGDGSARIRSASLGVSVGGGPEGVGAASPPGTAPRTGRSLAGAQAVPRKAAPRKRNAAASGAHQRRVSDIRAESTDLSREP